MAGILITDDTAFMRMTLKNILSKSGFEIVGEAADGLEAVAQYKALNPDLVTMDITMPNMDGISATKEIMKYDANAKVIVCSAMGQKTLVIEALSAGAKDFVVKPFQPDRIVDAIAKVLNS
ncbi:MAG: response regulator [Firmicutes bacterium]|nr:response regulator [Bacillota bacterium]